MDEQKKILQDVECFARQERLFVPPGPDAPLRLCAAVSGGADSMALLHILLALQPAFGYRLSACHVNHGLRGAAADRDEAFVRAECTRLGVPLRVFCPQNVGFVQPPHAGEDWARRLRYACFETALRSGIDRIATAHTGTDQAETLLLRLARGTGLHGAGGIRPGRPGFCRPLLVLTRAGTQAFCTALGQPWVTDETNETDAYARNRVRHTVLPALQSVNDAAEENLTRFCEKAARADACLTRLADALLAGAAQALPPVLPAGARYARSAGQPVWRLDPLAEADPFLLDTALHGLVAPVRDAEERFVRQLAALVRQGSGAVQLTAAVRFCAGGGVLWREEAAPASGRPEPPPELPFCPGDGAEWVLPGGWRLKTRLWKQGFPEKIQGVHKKDLKNQADYARITTLYPALVLRCRRSGDRFRPAGRGVSRELRKWMNEIGIPPRQRDTLPLLAAGSEVVWVCGAGFAEGLAPAEDTACILQMEPWKMEEKQ